MLTSFTRPKVHPPLQPGSTPWRGNRRYLCKVSRLFCSMWTNSTRLELDWCSLDC
jgi:chromosome transmission fidelity protein 4